jgi:hypothetical protein
VIKIGFLGITSHFSLFRNKGVSKPVVEKENDKKGDAKEIGEDGNAQLLQSTFTDGCRPFFSFSFLIGGQSLIELLKRIPSFA